MDRRHFPPYDPHNSSNSYYGSYDSSHNSYNSFLYRDNGYPIPYGEPPPIPPRPQSHDMFTLPCSFCKCRFHTASDCYHLNGELPISNPLWWRQHHQAGNPYSNTNFGWNGSQNFQREEGYNYGVPRYHWEPSSQFETPNLPTMTNPFQPSPPPRNDDVEVLLKSMADTDSQVNEIQKIFEGMSQKYEAVSGSFSTLKKSMDATHSQLEKLAEQHLQDFILEPAQGLSEQQDRVHEPSAEDNDSEDVDEIIEIDDRPSLTISPPSSPPCDDRLLRLMIQWLVDQTVLNGSELDQEEEELKEEYTAPSVEEVSEDKDKIIIDDMPSPAIYPSPPLPSHDEDQQSDKETSSMQAEIGMHDFDSLACDEFLPSTLLLVSTCTCRYNKPCSDCFEIEEWLAPTQCSLLDSLETTEVSKVSMVLEHKEEQEESPSSPLPPSPEQLETKIATLLTPPPFIVEFVFSSHTFHSLPCLYDFLSLCDAGVKETRIEEYFFDQREGNMLGSLQRRCLLPLWIFKENLKPD